MVSNGTNFRLIQKRVGKNGDQPVAKEQLEIVCVCFIEVGNFTLSVLCQEFFRAKLLENQALKFKTLGVQNPNPSQ